MKREDSKVKRIVIVVAYFLLSCSVWAGTISLSANVTLPCPNPDPNQDITVWVNTNAPLFYMDVLIRVEGDATITEIMNPSTIPAYGWDAANSEPSTINPDNSVRLCGLKWGSNTLPKVGYFKFRCNYGKVTITIDADNSTAHNWTQAIGFNTNPLIIGSTPIIVINSDITTNQIWLKKNIYHVAADTVNVQALLVIEPGTMVLMSYQSALFVNNGGTLIAKGLPDKPVLFTPDYLYPSHQNCINYFWQILWWQDVYYLSAIYVESSASTATTIRHCFIEGAVAGIVTENIRLANPIENNWIYGNGYGIWEMGPRLTDIKNNLCFYNDHSGIAIYPISDPNDVPDTDHILMIEQNTCDYSRFNGIALWGFSDPNHAPSYHLRNNIVTQNMYGLCFSDGHMQTLIENTGYYGNINNKNEAFEENASVMAATHPFVPEITFDDPCEGGPLAHHRLAPDSLFVNAGTDWIDHTPFIGMTTDENSLSDKDKIDLGFHVFDMNKTGSGEIEGMDINDFLVLSASWLTYSPYDPNSPGYVDPNDPGYDPNSIHFGGDYDGNSFVDMEDFALLADLWLVCFELPDLAPVIEGDPNQGYVTLTATGYTPDTHTIYAYQDGTYLGRCFCIGTTMPIRVDTSESGNRPQQIKLLAMDNNERFYYSGPTEIRSNSPMSYCIVPEMYEPNEPIPFAAYYTGADNTIVSVYGDGGQLLWSQEFTGNTVSGAVPATVFDGHYSIDYVRFDRSVNPPKNKRVYPKISPGKINKDARALMISALTIPIDESDDVLESIIESAFKQRGIEYEILKGKNATWENIAQYAQYGNINYVWFLGHGNYVSNPGNILRTLMVLDDGPCYSYKQSDFVHIPSWCPALPPIPESKANTWASMGFQNLRFFYTESCYGGRLKFNAQNQLIEGDPGNQAVAYDGPHSDMTLALNMTDPTIDNQIYHAFYSPAKVGKLSDIGNSFSSYQFWSVDVWQKLGEGQTLLDALQFAINDAIRIGEDKPESALNNYRLKGHGTANFDFRLTNSDRN